MATGLGRAVMSPFAAGTAATDTDLVLLLRQQVVEGGSGGGGATDEVSPASGCTSKQGRRRRSRRASRYRGLPDHDPWEPSQRQGAAERREGASNEGPERH